MIIYTGAPGSGKGTQSKELAKRNDRPHVSTGDIVRAQASPEQLERSRRGELLTDEEMFGLLNAYISAKRSEGVDLSQMVLDGLPRTARQAAMLMIMLQRNGWVIEAAVNLEVPEEVVRERILARGEGRADDTPEAIEKRLAIDRRNRAEVLQFLAANGMRIVSVDGNQPREAVYNQTADGLSDIGISVQRLEGEITI